jgi:glutamine synthetase
MSYRNLTKYIKDNEIDYVDFRFTDILGFWHHISFPVSALTEDLIEEGIYFDGSSIAGWRAVHESDMVLQPNLTRFMKDPFTAQATAIIICDVLDPKSRQPYDRDPRSIAKRAEQYLYQSGIGSTAYFGPEAEFFVFDSIRFGVNGSGAFYEIDADEFPQTNQRPFGLHSHGHRPQAKGGYFPVAPLDSLQDMRSEMTTVMANMGLIVEKHHHEVAPAQHELGFKFGTLIETADNLQIYKYVVRNVAHSYGKTATFMAKPIFGDNGSGMHVHQSLWKENTPLFAGEEYSGLSETALYYIGGILKHAKSLNAFTNPTTNSYKRLVPGYEAPVILAYSAQNRSAACRIPTSHGEKAKRIEVRFPDPTANGYLAFAAMLMAGLDGIINKIHPGEASDHNLFEETEVAQRLPHVSESLHHALEALEQDHEYLLKGNVFSKDFLNSYCHLKWEEVYSYDRSPHPIEFQRYYTW